MNPEEIGNVAYRVLKVAIDWVQILLSPNVEEYKGAYGMVITSLKREDVTYLRRVLLPMQRLQTLPEWIGNQRQLRRLELGGNQLKRLPDWISNLTQLRHLNLNVNQLQTLPESLGNLTQLRTLLLGDNQLQTLPESLGNLTQLRVLDLSHNQLERLPDWIGKLSRLRELALSANHLQTLPESISNLIHLEELFLHSNELQSISEVVCHFTRLQRLTLDNNQLDTLPAGLTNLTRLWQLSLSGNQLHHLPEVVSNLTRLESLWLDHNTLKSLPESISNLRRLQTLSLRSNDLQTIPDSLGELKKLKELYLNNNLLLISLPRDLKVVQLDVSGCRRFNNLPENLIVTAWLDLADTTLAELPVSVQIAQLRWRGVRIDQRIAFHPETLTAQDILAERNVERRRVMLERVGYAEFLRQAQPAVLDTDHDVGGERRLLRIDLAQDEPLVCLSVIDPSTGRQYVLRVPPNMTTCQQAAAWIAGFDNPADYYPLVET